MSYNRIILGQARSLLQLEHIGAHAIVLLNFARLLDLFSLAQFL